MESMIEIDGQRIGIDFQQKPVKNTYLRFDDEKLVVVSRNQKSMQKILQSHREWIKKHYVQIRSNVRLFDSSSIFYKSKRYRVNYIQSESRPKADISEDVLTLYAATRESAERLIDRMIRDDTERVVQGLVAKKTAEIGTEAGMVQARKYRKWGTCKRDRNITFNYCLSMLPNHLQDYVVSHEVAHLREMNHSRRFWNVVQGMCGDYKKLRKELRQYDSKRRSVVATTG